MWTRVFLLLMGLLPAWAASAQAPGYDFRYHTYGPSTARLQELAKAYPRLAKLYSIGKSATGTKEIWCIEIGNQDTGGPDSKPAVYFDGNQHASEVTGGEVTLHLAHYLLTRYGADPDVTRLVDTRVTYIVQRGDPDGAEATITGTVDWDPESAPGARDADGDGRKGEDGPEDVDGDGQILEMRILDPDGGWKSYGPDPRIMVRREAGDTEGPFYRVLSEGTDNDGDGEVNEDAPVTGFISNRNYPAYWASTDGRFRGEGDYPLQEQNARVLVDFILSKPQISQIESWHTTSGIHLRPYAARPDTDFPPQDLQDYSAILAKGTAITTYPVASVYNDFTTIAPGVPFDEQPGVRHGVFIVWSYVHQGLFSVTTELWTMEPFVNEMGWGEIPRDRPLFAIPGRYNRPDVLAAVLRWLDAHRGDPSLSGEGFMEWKAFQHPTLGAVEVGGFTRYWLRNPPPGPFLQKVVEDQARFAVVRALLTPLVKIQDVSVRPGGRPGEWTVTATVANEGYLDTSMEQARRADVAQTDRVTMELGAGATTADPLAVSFPFMRGARESSFVSFYRASWTVEAPEGTRVTVVLRSEKGGTDRREAVLGGGTHLR
ncbi:MAG: M14 family metallopeptidase [Longimicrobiales bacterium]|nr:M14 family metallopeptidase [Longimicrobiales bacterium]